MRLPQDDGISAEGLVAFFIAGVIAWTLIGYGIYRAVEALT